MSIREKQMLEDFELYSRALIESKDVDPVYDFLTEYFKQYKIDGVQQRQWLLFCYVSFYSLESMHLMFHEFPMPWDFDVYEFMKIRHKKEIRKFGHERRGSLRNPANQVHQLEAAAEAIRTNDFDYSSNINFRKKLTRMPFQGPWASFKIAELYEKVLGKKELEIKDLGIDEKDQNSNDGPCGGLRWLFGRDMEYGSEIKPVWNRFGEKLAKAWGVDIGKVETCFCKWHKMMSGKYYIAHDIHEFVELKHVLEDDYYPGIMSECFEPLLWMWSPGISKISKGTYKNTGVILNAEYAKKLPKIDVGEIMYETIEEFEMRGA